MKRKVENVVVIMQDHEPEDWPGQPKIPEGEETIGIGFSFDVNEQHGRCAVRIPINPSHETLVKAVKVLGKMLDDPFAPESNTVWDPNNLLLGNEVCVDCKNHYAHYQKGGAA